MDECLFAQAVSPVKKSATHGWYWHLEGANHPFRDAAYQEVGKACSTVSPDHDEICATLFSCTGDLDIGYAFIRRGGDLDRGIGRLLYELIELPLQSI